MNVMEFKAIDKVLPFQLEAGDFIKVDGDIVQIAEIADVEDTYAVFYFDAFEEKEFIEFNDDDLITLYIPD